MEEEIKVDGEERRDNQNQYLENFAKVKVVGVGGGGCNAVNNMVSSGILGVEFYVMNTDSQALSNSICDNKVVLGYDVTKGLGAGANPQLGMEAALESESQIKECLQDADMVFIASGMGGGTGTGAAPVVAKIAKSMGVLTVAIVTKPFEFEGTKRGNNAEKGVEELQKHVDSIIIISNQNLLELIGDIPFSDAFKEADKILMQAVQTITDLIAVPAQINLDFADIKTVLEQKGLALIGVGLANGENKAEEAAKKAISCPLLETPINGAKHAIVNITSANASLSEVKKAINTIKKASNYELDIIYGMSINKHLENEMLISVIATGFDGNEDKFDEEIGRIHNTGEINKERSVEYDDDSEISDENNTSQKSRNNDDTDQYTNDESDTFSEQFRMQKERIKKAKDSENSSSSSILRNKKRFFKKSKVKEKKKLGSETIDIPSFLRKK